MSVASRGFDRGPRIAVIYAVGAIVGGRSGYDPLNGATVGSETLIESIRAAQTGFVGAGDRAARRQPGRIGDGVRRGLARADAGARRQAARSSSMSDLAASGGYYIAMPGHAIVAQPSTLTGSIGIFGGKFVTGGVYEKLGANIESTSIGKHAEMNSPARPYNADELKKVDEQLESFYAQFVGKVAAARGKTPEQINAIAQGRVWTGRQASQNGLVDALGGLDTAIDIAKEKAGIDADDSVQLVVYPAPKSFYELVERVLRRASAGVDCRVADDEPVGGRAGSAARAAGPGALFRRGEIARADAVYVLTLRQGSKARRATKARSTTSFEPPSPRGL